MRLIRFIVMIAVIVYAYEYVKLSWPTKWPKIDFPMPPPPWELLDDAPEILRKEGDRLAAELEKIANRGEQFRKRTEQTIGGIGEEQKKKVQRDLDQTREKIEQLKPKIKI